ncbi:phosphonate ABC transporter, permease protein PhnE [Polymorphum gilvum]|uniref:Phosphonate ABC transporter, permease protein n=1 Tax=Polymorphum gilvum (strain LMG 25793 / CGMCC 1.9160 / SL003B-26A1) TaxID=991905 RepID=F2IW25_POLGS|nr:phosphonate ABC transporter, permease protein PhnE [Polymorphum gilvum]ADZ70307.1 Phosphonate ABC transporter, permease protein [Polymorphum gilvum SL003B-26A1]
MADALLAASQRSGAIPSPNAGQVGRIVRARILRAFGVPLLVLLYLAYAWNVFGVTDLLGRADPERGALLALDTLYHKVHVEKNLRRGDFTVAVEGERTATWPAGTTPNWVVRDGERSLVDLGDGYAVEIEGDAARLVVPDYGIITARVVGEGIEVRYPGPVPSWVSGNEIKFDARPTFDRRLQVSRSKIEVHRYFFGWENFWFPFGSPLQGLSAVDLIDLAWSDQRIDASKSNLGLIWDSFWGNPDWQHGILAVALFETLLMALLGTMTAALLALPLAFLAASNFTPSLLLRFGVRRVFDFVRAVDSLIWSLIFIRAFGLGPLTGSLAIAITDMGSLGKLFSEALENIDRKQVEGVDATGANRLQSYRFGVIPQILPVLMSQSLYYLESNTRSATVIGALGAGGIGLVLVETMKTSRDWENVAYIILLTLVLVIAMDSLSGWLRRRLIEGR